MLLDINQIKDLLDKRPPIVFVGCSANSSKAAHHVPAYIQEQGFKIFPINPTASTILGEPVCRKLSEISPDILRQAVVVLFRPSSEVPLFLAECIRLSVPVLWTQEGISHVDAIEKAEANQIDLVDNKCILKVYKELFV
ncbi:hypothetical protein GEMRC1_011207 [Eukaryota sp. GEM-RC1]